MNNGSEFTGADFTSWCRKKRIHLSYNQPGKPMQSGFIKRFNGSYFRKILDAYLLIELEEVSFKRFVMLWYKLPHKKFFCF
ncbi:transposase [Pontibacter diazotrophicus]|uniref:Transposase n=1 Tax=Pontibacter diazotrophicus TaxID=1400979 RepID=A0A3D8L6E1_9BACT|nr:transposase [Pontibacter diazotrophicus]